MLLKFGVDISKLEFHCRKALSIVESVFASHTKDESVITSTYEGTHWVSSLHYQNRAFDLRLPSTFAENLKNLIDSLREKLGRDFDVVLESDHIHIEYDPK